MFKLKKSGGFTVIELLLVISIIALLSSLVLVLLSGARAQGRDAARKAQTDSLRKALAFYYADYGTYPTTTGWVKIEDTANAEVAALRAKLQPYLPTPPGDPLYGNEKSAGVPYSYQYYGSSTVTGDTSYKLHTELETGLYAAFETFSDSGEDITYGGGGTSWSCGDTVTFTYKGSSVTYGTVNSTGTKCWMDKNLGAGRIAENATDSLAYGDLFQWGRLDDLHQNRASATTTATSSSDVPGHSSFIINSASADWRVPKNDYMWNATSSIILNNPCPSGWRVPTSGELDAERASWSQQNWNGAFASPLKLTAGGYRYYDNGSLNFVGIDGMYWSSTVNGASTYNLYFDSGNANMFNYDRANGFSVRCVQD